MKSNKKNKIKNIENTSPNDNERESENEIEMMMILLMCCTFYDDARAWEHSVQLGQAVTGMAVAVEA